MVKLNDELLYQYMPVVDSAILHTLEKSTDTNYVFSASFERKMHRLFQKERKIEMWKKVKKITSRVAIFICIIFISFFSIVMSVDAYRVKFFETIKSFVSYDNTVLFSYNTTSSDTFEEKTPEYIPDSYFLQDTHCNENTIIRTYENTNGEQLILHQQAVSQHAQNYFDDMYDQKDTVSINGIDITIQRYDDGSVFTYCEFHSSIFMINANNMETDEIKRIYEHWIK